MMVRTAKELQKQSVLADNYHILIVFTVIVFIQNESIYRYI